MFTEISLPEPLKERHRGIANILAFVLLPISGFATDIYLPSLPAMASTMHLGNIQVQFTLTLFLISYGITQLFIGSVLDSFGRRKLSLFCLVIFAAASIAIANTQNIYLIYCMRVLHGITVGTIMVAKRAYFIDLFTGEKLKSYLSLFSIIWSTGPIIAPFLGGYLQLVFGWQSNFYFLAFYALILAVLEYIFSGETLRHFAAFDIKKIAAVYAGMFKTTSFTLSLAMCGLAYCMVMIYNMTGPFIIEHKLHLSPVITGYGSLTLGLAWMAGGFMGKATINRPLFKRVFINVILQMIFACVMLLSIRWIDSLYSLLFFAFMIQLGAGFTFNNFFTYCLSKFPNNAGIASGLTGGINYVIVSVLSYGIVFFLHPKDEYNLGYSYLVLILLSALVMLIFKLKKEKLSFNV